MVKLIMKQKDNDWTVLIKAQLLLDYWYLRIIKIWQQHINWYLIYQQEVWEFMLDPGNKQQHLNSRSTCFCFQCQKTFIGSKDLFFFGKRRSIARGCYPYVVLLCHVIPRGIEYFNSSWDRHCKLGYTCCECGISSCYRLVPMQKNNKKTLNKYCIWHTQKNWINELMNLLLQFPALQIFWKYTVSG